MATAALSILLSGCSAGTVVAPGGDTGGAARVELSLTAVTKNRPLVTLMTTLASSTLAYAHDATYYQNLAFGSQFPNGHDYFLETSRGRFTFTNAGIYGPVAAPTGRSDAQRVGDVVRLLEAQGFPFANYDSNGDGAISDDELEIMSVDNLGRYGGMNRGAGCTQLANSALQVCSRVAFIAEETDFRSMVHELSHSLGAFDIYGNADGTAGSNGLSLMSYEPFIPNDMTTLYHDPWHRAQMGWLNPVKANPAGGQALLGDESFRDANNAPAQPVAFYKSGTNEYYLFEYRGPYNYDKNVADVGIIAWHVTDDGQGNPVTNSNGQFIYSLGPDYRMGGHVAWKPSTSAFQITWADGTAVPFYFAIDANSSNSMRLRWVPQTAPVGCVPHTCATAGANCGQINSCGLFIQCGSCPDGEICGGGGIQNVCAAASSCVPRRIICGHRCGVFDDGCGNQVCCGNGNRCCDF
jgi:M6 family metalloprotease-like protein